MTTGTALLGLIGFLQGQETELFYHRHKNINSNLDKMRQQMKEQDKSPEKLSEMDIGNLNDFKDVQRTQEKIGKIECEVRSNCF